jgi:hypothetical protein
VINLLFILQEAGKYEVTGKYRVGDKMAPSGTSCRVQNDKKNIFLDDFKTIFLKLKTNLGLFLCNLCAPNQN